MKLYTAKETKKIDSLAIKQKGITGYSLMQMAAEFSLDVILREFSPLEELVIFCSKGKNSGDGFLLGSFAKEFGLNVTVVLSNSPNEIKGVSKKAFQEMKESKVTLFDIKSGEKLESAAAWASYDPRNASRMHVGYFIPDAEQETGAGEMENLQLCGFTKPENCKNEQPYPRDETNTEPLEDPFECGIDDETNSDTGFVCEKVSFKVEEDGDLAYEGDISMPNEKEGEGDAAASTNNRKLLQLRRRGVGLRSRSLRSNGARGRIG